MRHVAMEEQKSRGRLAFDPLDPDRTLWCQHVCGARAGNHVEAFRKPIGFRMFALDDGEFVRLRYVDEGEFYIMKGEHAHATDSLLEHAECVVCGARIDLRCKVEMAP